ncbi:hypothetical protein SHIRM173S_13385 [Streptomyces hirsutus]
MPRRENCLASVPPDMQYGTGCPSGANSCTAARMRANVVESTGDWRAGSRWWNSQSTSGPVSRSRVARKSSSPPGRIRPSMYASAWPGITLTL